MASTSTNSSSNMNSDLSLAWCQHCITFSRASMGNGFIWCSRCGKILGEVDAGEKKLELKNSSSESDNENKKSNDEDKTESAEEEEEEKEETESDEEEKESDDEE